MDVCACLYVYIYIYIYIYIDIHAYIYMQAVAASRPKKRGMQLLEQTYIYTNIHTYVHANIQTCIHAYIYMQAVAASRPKKRGMQLLEQTFEKRGTVNSDRELHLRFLLSVRLCAYVYMYLCIYILHIQMHIYACCMHKCVFERMKNEAQ